MVSRFFLHFLNNTWEMTAFVLCLCYTEPEIIREEWIAMRTTYQMNENKTLILEVLLI